MRASSKPASSEHTCCLDAEISQVAGIKADADGFVSLGFELFKNSYRVWDTALEGVVSVNQKRAVIRIGICISPERIQFRPSHGDNGLNKAVGVCAAWFVS